MARDPRHRYRKTRKKLNEAAEKGEISEADKDAITEFLDAKDSENIAVNDPNGRPKSASTLYQYAKNLRIAAERADPPLSDTTASEINSYLQGCLSGTHPAAPDGGLSSNTVKTYAGNLRVFYRYHSALGVNPEAIAMPQGDDPQVDPSDMFTPEEIQDLRDACTNARDECLLELMLNTGQRVRAIQTLRIKDVFPEAGRYRLNPEADGLKSAEGRRPLLGAQNAVRDWAEKHPQSDNPDAYLLTRLPSYADPNGNTERDGPDEALGQQAIRGALQRIAARAGIDKPTHPHAFRHNFVTICKRDYDMETDTIKHLIGHAPESRVMETTYSHLSDEDFNEDAEIAAGIKDPEESETLTPETCPTCSEPLPPAAKACPRCGQVFTPDAAAVEDALETLADQQVEKAAWRQDKGGVQSAKEWRDRIKNDADVRNAFLNKLSDDEIQNLIESANAAEREADRSGISN